MNNLQQVHVVQRGSRIIGIYADFQTATKEAEKALTSGQPYVTALREQDFEPHADPSRVLVLGYRTPPPIRITSRWVR